MRTRFNPYRLLAVGLLSATLTLAGCSGDDGKNGAPGAAGPTGPAGAAGPTGATGATGASGVNGATGPTGPGGSTAADEACVVCHGPTREFDVAAMHPGLQPVADAKASITSVAVAVDTPNQKATVTVNFTATDANGNYIPLLGAKNPANTNLWYIRFALAWLEPAATGSGDPDLWSHNVTANTNTIGERTYANLTDNKDGTYSYVFATNMYPLYSTASNLDLTHRLLMIISDTVTTDNVQVVPRAVNVVYEFVPSGKAITTTRNIVTTAACNECHGRLGSTLGSASFHGGSRYAAEGCPVCHTNELGTEGDAEAMVFFHKIHAANYKDATCSNDATKSCTTDADCGTGYTCLGDLGDFTDVTYPQPLQDCAKCHKGTPDGDHWKTRPSIKACGSCHNTVNFATGENHAGGAQPDNSLCAACHPSGSTGLAPIPKAHLTQNATPNNPDVPAGLVNFKYEIKTVTVNTNSSPVVTFRILKQVPPADFAPVTFNTFATGGTVLLAGMAPNSSPSFLVAYAKSQDGVTKPADYNQLGRSAGQPASVSILNIWNGTQGTLTGPDGDGYYVATINGSNNAGRFPTGAIMRAVSLQGYFTQDVDGNGTTTTDDVARHTISVVTGVTGDDTRRVVVDPAKCANCHEWFEGHGGNRVYETQVCVICHNPNLSSSGRGANPANIDATNKAALQAAGYDPNNPLTFPEATNNLKDMIHGIHASALRDFPFEFVRDRGTSGVFYFDFAEVTFPGIPSNCETCHKPGTYDAALPANVLMSTDRTTGVANGQDPTTAAVTAARGTVPNATDWVNSPTAAACYMCHDSNPAAAHFGQMGGVIDANRSAALGK